MQPSLIHEILLHLYHEDIINQKQINITAFLKGIQNENDDRTNNFNRIVMALERIKETGYASFNCSPENHVLNQPVNGQLCTLDNTDVNMEYNIKGWDYIRNFLRENEQQASILGTNNSIKALNDQLPKIYQTQTNLTYFAVFLTLLSLVAIGFSAYYASQTITATQIDVTNRLLRKEVEIDSTRLTDQKFPSAAPNASADSSKAPILRSRR